MRTNSHAIFNISLENKYLSIKVYNPKNDKVVHYKEKIEHNFKFEQTVLKKKITNFDKIKTKHYFYFLLLSITLSLYLESIIVSENTNIIQLKLKNESDDPLSTKFFITIKNNNKSADQNVKKINNKHPLFIFIK
jgi:hypothetical protein